MIQNNSRQYFSLGRNSHQIVRDGPFTSKKDLIQNQLLNHHVVEHNIIIQGLLKKLHATLLHEKVPDFYGYFFMGQLTLCSEDRISDNLTKELQLLKNKHSHYHLIIRTVIARQSCLKSLSHCIQSVFQLNEQNLMQKLKSQIQHLRHLSSLVIQQIMDWKNSLLSLNTIIFREQHIAFYYRNEDYLLKILGDTNFISQSFLSSKVIFSHKQDPFLMRPYTQNQSNDVFVQLFKFQQNDKVRFMNCLQSLAEERADYLKRKIAIKQDRIKQIQRVYQSRQLVDKILVTKVHPISLKKAKPQQMDIPIDFIQEKIKQQPKINSFRLNSVSQSRKVRNKQLNIKGEQIKKIKDMNFSNSNPKIINPLKFNVQNDQKSVGTLNRSISLGMLKKSSNIFSKSDKQQNQTDFQTILRKKELQVLQSDSLKKRTFSSFKLKDRLSERKLIDNKDGAEQLRKILDQLQHSSPLKQQDFAIKISNNKPTKSLLQHNEEVLFNLRKVIQTQIQTDVFTKEKQEEQKRNQENQLQKIIKMKMDQISLNDIAKQKQKWTEGKDILAHQFEQNSIFGFNDRPPKSQKLIELQQELKRQMQLKFLREVHQQLSHRQEMNKMSTQRKKQELQREKQMEIVNRKKEQQLRFQQIQNQQKNKMTQQILKEQEIKKKQIQQEMHKIVQREQQRLIEYSGQQRIKLQNQIRQTMKEKLLTQLKRQKSEFITQKKAEENKRNKQQAHREEVKKKMEQDFQIEKTLQRQRERQEKNRKLRLVAQKMNNLQQQAQQQKIIKQKDTNNQNLQELKRSLNDFPNLRNNNSLGRQQNKKKLRQQFELQLFSFKRPESINTNQNNFVVKEFINKFDNQQTLDNKMEQLAKSKLQQNHDQQNNHQQNKIDQKNTSVINLSSAMAFRQKQSDITSQFVRFSQNQKEKEKVQEQVSQEQVRLMGIDMTPQQYKIYNKKKIALNPKRIIPLNQQEISRMKQKEFHGQFVQMINLQKQPKQMSQQASQSSKINQKNKQQSTSKLRKQSYQKWQQKNVLNEQENLEQMMKLTVHSKIGSLKKKRFISQQSSFQQNNSPKANKKYQQQKIKQKRQQRHKKQQQSSQQQVQEKIEKKSVIKYEIAIFIKVNQQNFDQYLTNHYQKLSKLIRRLNLLKKDQLLKSLMENYKSLLIIEVKKGQNVLGIAIAVQNQNKQNIRSFNIMHAGSYQPENIITVLIKARDLIFAKDPCTEITYSMYYDKNDQEQNVFIKQFQVLFDAYGAIFQKIISNSQTQRKHVLRRMIGEDGVKQINKFKGELNIQQHLFAYNQKDSLGVELNLQTTGKRIGGWTFLSLFISKYGKDDQIVSQLTSEVKQSSKNIKHISKMAMKLKNNLIKDVIYQKYQSPFDMNLMLVEEGVDLVKCDPSIQQQNVGIYWLKNTLNIQPNLPFVSSTANFHNKSKSYSSQYLRYKCKNNSKVMKLKSNLYSNVITVLPCKPSNYKILLTDSQQYDNISGTCSLDLYIKLFLANVSSHALGSDQYLWLPRLETRSVNEIQYCKEFGFKNQLRSKMSLNYTEYIPNSLHYTPSHRDLFITPPFIMAILNSQIQKSTQGSPIYIERIDIQQMVGVVPIKIEEQSDF